MLEMKHSKNPIFGVSGQDEMQFSFIQSVQIFAAENRSDLCNAGAKIQMKRIGIFPSLRLNLLSESGAAPAFPQRLMPPRPDPAADVEGPKKMRRATDAHQRRH